MDSQTPPKNLRTILLATPKKTRRTKKYNPPVYKGKVYSGVRPSAIRGPVEDNWRINTLATATLRRRVDPTLSLFRTPGISQSTLLGKGTYRTNDLAITPLRKLRLQKKAYSYLGPKFTKTMDKHIDKSWKSLYHFYDRTLLELKKKRKGKGKGKGDAKGKGKGKKGSKTGKGKPGKKKAPPLSLEERLKKFAAWAAVCALPKKIFLPPPGKPRKIADLNKIGVHMGSMARPNFVTKKFIRPSIDPEYVDPLRVSDGAKSYVISERVKKLAECPPHRLIREPVFKPGAVKRSALTCKVSPRFNELAVPRKTAKEKDTEFKENPFEISRNALKYKPSARILELAKPTERT